MFKQKSLPKFGADPSLEIPTALFFPTRHVEAAKTEFDRGKPLVEQLNPEINYYADALQQCTQGFLVLDKNGNVRFANKRFAQIYSISIKDVQPGQSLERVLEAHILSGHSDPNSLTDYLNWFQSVAPKSDLTQFIGMKNDVRVKIRHIFYPDGSCISIHEENQNLALNEGDDDEHLFSQYLIDAMPDYMWVKDIKSRFRIANKALAQDLGFKDVKSILGMTDKDFHSPQHAKQFRATELAVLRSGMAIVDAEELVTGQDGVGKWMLSTKIPLKNKDGRIVGMAGISRDITKRKTAEAFTAGQARILELIATAKDLSNVLDELINLIESQMTGVLGSVMLADHDKNELNFLSGPRFASNFCDLVQRIPIGADKGSCGTAAYLKDIVVVSDIHSDPRWTDYREQVAQFGFKSCWSAPIFDASENVVGTFAFYSAENRIPNREELETVELATRIAGIAIDNKRTKQKVDYLTTHDELTKLRNRATFNEILEQTIRYANRQKNRFSIIYINIDSFKLINDSLGHQTGDLLLIEVSNRLLASVRASDHVIRIGGDEFVVVLLDQPQAEQASLDVFEKIKSTLSDPVVIDNINIRITSSIGVAYYPEDGRDSGTILANASAAMHRAKEVGRDNIQFYTTSMNIMLREKFDLQSDLRDAIGTDQIFVNYQPQIDLRSGRVFATEALVRWNHPKFGLVSPAKFIPLAEQSGLIQALGNWVLREACIQNKRWQNAGLPPITVCVNVSARQFKNRNIIDNTLIALEESGLDARYLELEITESLIMQDIAQSISIMGELKAMGIKIAIDDFGTGYSSLSALKTFPVVRLKIDKSFVNDIAINASDKAVTSAVISLGQKLNLRVIAEGVETEAQLKILKENDCDEIQGYHFSKPLSAEAFEAFVRNADVR